MARKKEHHNEEEGLLGQPLMNWDFPEFIKYERTHWWYIISFVFLSGLLVYSLVVFNYLFAVILIMFAFILTMHHYQEPHTVNFLITDQGVIVGTKFFPYEELEAFWIVYDPPISKRLLFRKKNIAKSRIIIPLQDADPLEVRAHLEKFLPEDVDDPDDTLSDVIGRLFKI